MLHAVVGDPELHALLADGFGEVANQIALRPHLLRVPPGERAIPHGEAVVVLGGGHHVARAGLAEQLRPLVRVELRGGKEGNEVFISEYILRAEVLLVPGDDFGIAVHVLDVPLALVRGDGIQAPVQKDAELAIAEPLRELVVGLDGFPGRFKGSFGRVGRRQNKRRRGHGQKHERVGTHRFRLP